MLRFYRITKQYNTDMLYIVGTPLGNIKDITLRALEILNDAEFLVVENKSDALKLLKNLDIPAPELFVYNDSNKKRAIKPLIEKLKNVNGAFITSAGMPGVSDPGPDLVAACRKEAIDVIPVPGASAFSTAISVSGIRAQKYTFAGFLPKTKGKITKIISLLTKKDALVFFESPFRIRKTLEHLDSLCPTATIFVGKEMTKKFETYLHGNVHEIHKQIASDPMLQKGEFTCVLKLEEEIQKR